MYCNKNSRLRIYKATARPIITYAAETIMTLTNEEEEKLNIEERTIIRTIMVPKQIDEN